MTKSLWCDPIFDNMDPISQRVLPYLSSAESDQLLENADATLPASAIKKLLLTHSYRGYDLRALFKERLKKAITSEVNIELPELPDEIAIDIVDDTISIEDLHVKLSVTTSPETIASAIADLLRDIEVSDYISHPEDQNRVRKHLKRINAIFSDRKISYRRLNFVKHELFCEATRWLIQLDIRSADFPHRFKKELLSAINGDPMSVLWLKVLKARSLSKEPIYSMELT